MTKQNEASDAEDVAVAMYYKKSDVWPINLQIEQVAAFMQGAKWLLHQAEKIAHAPSNGMATEDIAFVEQLQKLFEAK